MIYQPIESEIFFNILLHRLSKQTTNKKKNKNDFSVISQHDEMKK